MAPLESAQNERNPSLPEYVFGQCVITGQWGALRRLPGVGHVCRRVHEGGAGFDPQAWGSVFGDIFGGAGA